MHRSTVPITTAKPGIDLRPPDRFHRFIRAYNKTVGLDNKYSSEFLAPMKDLRDGSWITCHRNRTSPMSGTYSILTVNEIQTALESKTCIKTASFAQQKEWVDALKLNKVCDGVTGERHRQFILWAVEGKLDQDGWIR